MIPLSALETKFGRQFADPLIENETSRDGVERGGVDEDSAHALRVPIHLLTRKRGKGEAE